MKRGRTKDPVPAMEVSNPDSPSSHSQAASFADALDIILSTQEGELHRDTTRALRLVCKAIRFVVDSHVNVLEYTSDRVVRLIATGILSRRRTTGSRVDSAGNDLEAQGKSSAGSDEMVSTCRIGDLTSWPWPNVSDMKLLPDGLTTKQDVHRDVEYLGKIPLLKLERLSLSCVSVLPLVDCHFPNLTLLDLTVLRAENDLNLPAYYPKSLEFPRWPLKKLFLEVEKNPSDCKTGSPNISFLGPLLKSCVELTYFDLKGGDLSTELTVDMIVSAPLPRLETLVVQPTVSSEFYPTLFSREWPAFRRLSLNQPSSNDHILALITSKDWVKQLEHVEISFEKCIDATAEELHTFLKALESGVVEELRLPRLPFSLLKGFKAIRLERLKSLKFVDMERSEMSLDVSALINLLFESCVFPKLETLGISADIGNERWFTPPRVIVRNPIVFPKLRAIQLDNLILSREVAHYLGNFRRQTGCTIDGHHCGFANRQDEPTLECQLVLEKLNLDYEEWEEFCGNQLGASGPDDFVYWNAMTIERFTRIAFGAALIKCTDVTKLAAFINLVEAEEKGTVMTTEVLEMLKSLLNRRLLDESRLGVSDVMTWNKINTLIDMKF